MLLRSSGLSDEAKIFKELFFFSFSHCFSVRIEQSSKTSKICQKMQLLGRFFKVYSISLKYPINEYIYLLNEYEGKCFRIRKGKLNFCQILKLFTHSGMIRFLQFFVVFNHENLRIVVENVWVSGGKSHDI